MFDPGEYIRQIATHYPDSDSIRRVLGFAEVDLLHIDMEGAPLDIWFASLVEAHRQSKLDNVLQTITSEYPALLITPEKHLVLEKFLEKRFESRRKTKASSIPYLLIAVSVILFIFLLILFLRKISG